MLIEDGFLYLHADREFFEPLGRYVAAEGDFIVPMRRHLPPAWRMEREGIWVHCAPSGAEIPALGWKIHLSATLGNSGAVLATAARLMVERSVPFKFAADKMILGQLNGKRWPRGGAGKFVTIYPAGAEHCGALLLELQDATVGYSGPYILSDRRYRDSSIVHYRYGGFHPTRRVGVTGAMVPVMQAEGGYVDDERAPFFTLPDGMQDPFAIDGREDDGAGEGTLKQGRYEVRSVITFSTSGGVYLAEDRESGRTVVIKEARPFANVSPRGTDAVWLLKKEHRLLCQVHDAAIAPRALDFFKDWEHFYLVEELLAGKILRGYMARHALTLRVRASAAEASEIMARYCSVFRRIAEALLALHRREIVFSDISHYNVMVLDDEGADVRLIDFEGAYEQGVDPPTLLYTPGFAPAQMTDEGLALPADDLFGLGGLMLAGLMPINALLALDPLAYERFLSAWERDVGVPRQICRVIRGLLHPDRAQRTSLPEVIEVLGARYDVEAPAADCREADEEDGETLAGRILSYVESVADPARDDRLFPAAWDVFETNGLSVAHGACGVAHALHRVRGTVAEPVARWILRHDLSVERYPPGLYLGLCGIAWTLLELGFTDQAVGALRLAEKHHLRWRSPDLFYGAAGIGMTLLRFFLATGDERYRESAEAVGQFLVGGREQEDGKSWWPAQGDVCCGLAHGASGVSLFLLYLYRATGAARFLEVAGSGLDFVAARAVRVVEGDLSIRAKEGQPTYTPYWRWGSSGVARALLRYRKVRDDGRYDALLAGLLVDVERKYTIFPGFFFGLAGLGDLFLDLADLGGQRPAALAAARKALSGMLLFKLDRAAGPAFPGETLSRISCDYGTGGAGMALFAHRLVAGGGASYMLDELLDGP